LTIYATKYITLRSRALRSSASQKYPAIYGTQKYITIFTRAC